MSSERPVVATNEILNYFLRHPQAADDLEGIARWRILNEFVERTVDETRQALNWLVAEGYLSAVKRPGSPEIFRLNSEQAEKARELLKPARATRRGKDPHGEAGLGAEISIADLARGCGVSSSHFARAFKQSTGQPPHRWLLDRRIAGAQALLLKNQPSLQEIAKATGFSDQSNLTRAFSRLVGTSPAAWRRLRQGLNIQ